MSKTYTPELIEKLARAGHAAVLNWGGEAQSMTKPWDDLEEGERADLMFAAEFELLNPGKFTTTEGALPSQVFLESLFRGTVRSKYDTKQISEEGVKT